MQRKLNWPTAIVVLGCLGAFVGLTLAKVDTDNLMYLILSILAGAGIVQWQTIKEQTNGTQAQQLNLIRDLADKLHNAPPPAALGQVQQAYDQRRGHYGDSVSNDAQDHAQGDSG